MDFSGIPRGSIRHQALTKLAELTVNQDASTFKEFIPGIYKQDFSKLVTCIPQEPTLKLTSVITLKEYQVLLALCDSTNGTPKVKCPDQANQLVDKFKIYLSNLSSVQFAANVIAESANTTAAESSSSTTTTISTSTSPYTLLGEKLTCALINLGFMYGDTEDIIEFFQFFIHQFFSQEFTEFKYLTLIGFLQGFSNKAKFLSISARSFKLFTNLDSVIDNVEFLQDIEQFCQINYEEDNYEVSFSPIMYLEQLSKIMCQIINSIIENNKYSLLHFILKQIVIQYDNIDDNSLNFSRFQMNIIKTLSDMALQKLEFLDRGETFIIYNTLTRLKLGYLTKSHNLQVLSCGTFTDNWDLKISKRLFKTCIGIKEIMLDPDLGLTVFEFGSLLVFKDATVGPYLTRAFSSIMANPKLDRSYCLQASKSMGLCSKVLSQDAVVTMIYSLTNLLFVGYDGFAVKRKRASKNNDLQLPSPSPSEVSSLSLSNTKEFDEHDYKKVCENAIMAIIEICQQCNDESIPSLACTILSQKVVKIDSPVGPLILQGLISCAPFSQREFLNIIRLLNRLCLNALETRNTSLLENLQSAQVTLAKNLKENHKLEPVYMTYLQEMLTSIINKGDVQQLQQHRPHTEIREIGDQIAIYLTPLAELLPDVTKGESPIEITTTHVIDLFRNIWFNMVVHGYNINTTKQYATQLQRIAYNTPPLASEMSWDKTETSLELNIVLRRGSSNHNVKDHRVILGKYFEIHRTLSYPKLMFLAATMFIESLRVMNGDCSTIFLYLSDPSVASVDKYISQISFKIVQDYIQLVNTGANKQFSSDYIAEQLTNMLVLCCHPMPELQDVAIQCCDLLINKITSSLCHKKSLFSLFDILSLLFDSLVDSDINQYDPTTIFIAKVTGVKLLMSDDYQWRSSTFTRFHDKSKHWMKLLLYKCNIDVKSLIQSYVSSSDEFKSKVQFGVSFALETAGSISNHDRELSSISLYNPANLNTLPTIVSQLSWRNHFITEIINKLPLRTEEETKLAFTEIREKIYHTKQDIVGQSNDDIISLLVELAGLILFNDSNHGELIRYIVELPFSKFEQKSMTVATTIWFIVMKDRPNLSILLLSEIAKKWEESINLSLGVFSQANDIANSEFNAMEYAPSNKNKINKLTDETMSKFQPHLEIIKLFKSNFEATLNQSDHLLKVFTRFVEYGLIKLVNASYHPLARLVRFELIRFAFDVLNYHKKLGSRVTKYLTGLILDSGLTWFKQRSSFPFGRNGLKFNSVFTLLKDVARLTDHLKCEGDLLMKQQILLYFLDDEISKFNVWLNCLNPQDTRGTFIEEPIQGIHITKAYEIDPILAINLSLRYKIKNLDELLQKLITSNPLAAIHYPDAVQYFIGINAGIQTPSYHLIFWAKLCPIDSITLFLPPFGSNPYVLQYTMRSLESHDVNLTFFYVPQIVQCLRFDYKGYVERFILETAKVSQLFAHQIIWNMLANSYKDEDCTVADDIKPTLDKIQREMIASFTKVDRAFYEKEFGFFNQVTNISGKLKPYIKKSKAEKKEKIDEEMALIKVEHGVYLPSNPDGIVIDINRKSGKPLQSHAKAPFLATFKIEKYIENTLHTKWQSAIFKVGDDCRQDVLALQLISMFRTIWSDAGLDLFVFPYRVTATGPGCGVIDVLPNATSRDMLGREAVNGLYEYFITKFGGENSIEFQAARNNLIKSLAAYSIISYILQFKDRHNGNIMYDEEGHVLHIDFGFCFDIVPGGVKFEVAPFKLTKEMINVLGGNDQTQAFKWFEELCVKGFLSCRSYMETIVRTVTPMLESGLPCFKDTTIKNLRSRFVPGKSEKDASIFFRKLIKKSMESLYTKGYDEFQRLTNGIPY
ncbi:Phosphatidylinositol 4-kinase STT4 [Spathaspora sp. JA1]|nr:Phosphatidylinositol 4-kinase STT4 [Spathaspora sp. JA1]